MVEINSLNAAFGDGFASYHGDCVDVLRQVPDASVDFSVFSPPFSGLYIYNDSIADMGNSASDAEFLAHYRFFVAELFRVMRPGRIVAVHCKDLVYYKTQRGTAGLRDLPGMLIAEHVAAGFDFHSRVTIWRDPVREMTKTKAHGLLYKQLRADSTFSRQGLPEYFVVFRKWAEPDDSVEGREYVAALNYLLASMPDADQEEVMEAVANLGGAPSVQPVTHTKESFPLPQWQEWASPVWMKTRETDVLNARRDPADEKHICPMPLDLTERAVRMWSNPGDVVLSPFMGIGSEGVVALRNRRKFVGVELKESYWRQASRHLAQAEANAADLFAAD